MALQRGISIVIPNYNGKELLGQILTPAIIAVTNTGLPFEIIIADDASTDDSLAFLQREFPAVICLRSDVNGGFSVTANKGVRAAKYDWTLILNSDVKLTPDYFYHLLPYIEKPNLFGVMGRIVGWDDDQIQDGGKLLVLQGAKIKTSYNYQPLQHQPDIDYPTFYLSGANAFVNTSLFLQLGGFNELFAPFYIEDTELGLKAWRLGYECLYEHRAICRHRTSTTIATAHKKKKIAIIYNRNKMVLHAIHLNGWMLFTWFVQLKLELAFTSLTTRFTLLESYLQFWGKIDSVLKARKQLKKMKPTLSVSEVSTKIYQRLANQSIQQFKR
jgi:GT2 family glycosyltransferase